MTTGSPHGMDPRVVVIGRLRAAGGTIIAVSLVAAGVAMSLEGGARWAVVAAALVAAALGLLVIGSAGTIALAPRDVPESSDDNLGRVVDQLERLARGDALGGLGSGDRSVIALTPSLRKVSERIDRLTDARARAVAAERDLDHARKVYRAILPAATRAHHGVIKVAGHCVAADDCGGDWWVYRKLSDGRLLVTIGDATGHGVHAAMIDCAAHGAVETLALIGEQHLTPEQVLSAINRAIRAPGDKKLGMTCFIGILDPRRAVLDYANAGHNFPMVARLDANRVIERLDVLTGTGDPLGDDTEERPLEINIGSRPLLPGDLLLVFTDGLLERADKQGRQFGVRRLQKTLVGQKIAPQIDGLTAIRDTIVRAVDEFAAGTAMEDDMTFVLCMYDPAAPPAEPSQH